MTRPLLSVLVLFIAGIARAGDDAALRYWPRAERPAQAQLEERLLALPDSTRLSDWHTRFSSEPHRAGTPGDARLIDAMAADLSAMGLDVDVHRFRAYLAAPGSGRVSVLASPAPEDELGFASGATLPLELSVREWALPEDPFSAGAAMDAGWNAYSGSGVVESEIVYANYGTRDDFAELERLGVDVTGRIVLARYGKNFRGFKAKFAEAAGAAGLIMYSDPADNGFTKGIVYPEGGWANGSSIQRGSIMTLSYPGDPLTPFQEATPDAERKDAASLPLPKIPVQPIGWASAFEIIRRMRGAAVPEGWQGGLPASYRVTGGEELQVRLEVTQTRQLTDTANVIARLPGALYPDQLVLIGCHHDAWGYGAQDPNAGSIILFEVARAFTELARNGYRPARTLVFGNWGAEEFGIIGSVEWVEAHRDELLSNAVAYINLDSAINGPDFTASAAPELKALIDAVAREVPHGGDGFETARDGWLAHREDKPLFGDLGGGSDHVGFYCHLGVPSCGLGSTNAQGSAYHSAYDNLNWFRQVMGEDYATALMVTRAVALTAMRLADAPLLPLDPLGWAKDVERHLDTATERARKLGMSLETKPVAQAAARYRRIAAPVYARLLRAVERGELTGGDLEKTNRMLMQLSRNWLASDGLSGRPWYRNLYAATDPFDGYAAWMLPELRWQIEHARATQLEPAVERYVRVFEQLSRDMQALETLLP